MKNIKHTQKNGDLHNTLTYTHYPDSRIIKILSLLLHLLLLCLHFFASSIFKQIPDITSFPRPSSVRISKAQASQKTCWHCETPDVAHWGGFWSHLPKMRALYLAVRKQRASANNKITGQSSSKVSRSQKTKKGCRDLITKWAAGSWTASRTKEQALKGQERSLKSLCIS